MLSLPHRQFVFTIPKLLRSYFKHDRKLFADVSRLVHSIVTDYYNECAGKDVITGSIISRQTYSDMLRFNSYWHCIILEGGIDEKNGFYHVKIKDISKLTETFRKAVIKFFVDKELLNKDFAVQFSNWKNSGFSVDNSIFLFPYDDKARHPVSLKKITYEPVKKNVLYHTKYNNYWKENLKLFTVLDFIADLTIHILPKGKHLIRYYGLYASRTKGRSKQDGRFEKFGIKKRNEKKTETRDQNYSEEYKEVSDKKSRQSWVRLIQKVYEVNPFVCQHCGREMKVLAIIQDRTEIEKIIACLENNNKAPPAEKSAS